MALPNVLDSVHPAWTSATRNARYRRPNPGQCKLPPGADPGMSTHNPGIPVFRMIAWKWFYLQPFTSLLSAL